MIIKLLATKDTYVSSIKTKFNDGSLANVGQASTIDIFKIVSSNKDIKSQALMTFISNPDVNSTFKLIDSSNTEKIYTFIAGASNGNNIQIGAGVINTIDNITSVLNNAGNNLKITAFKASNSSIVFEQDITGASGKTDTLIANHNNKYTLSNFKLFEHSCGLVSFPISLFKSNNVELYSESVFNNVSNFKAKIKLSDVGLSNVKPRDMSIDLNISKNNFEEGLGKDILHFSDIGAANFSVMSNKESLSWENKDSILYNDFIVNSDFDTDTFLLEEGNEDVSFNVTGHLKYTLSQTTQKENFIISVNKSNLFDDYTYFVKRLGSSQIKNKLKKPTLEIRIKDSLVGYYNNKNKKRYLNNNETFYLKNIVDNKLTDFLSTDTVKLKIQFLNESNNDVLNIPIIVSGNTNKVYEYTGKEVKGIKKFVIQNDLLSRTNSNFLTSITKNRYVNINLKYYYNEENIIKEETVKFYVPDTFSSVSSSNIRAAINIQQQNLIAKNNLEFIKVSFIDIDKQHDTVKIPLALTTENLGDVYYSMYDVDTGKDIISFVEEEKEFTQLVYNEDDYILNMYFSKQYKNRRVNFIFYYDDIHSGVRRIIENKNIVVRFK